MSATMSETRPRLLIPGLQGFYAWAEPVSWLLVRLTVGLMLLPHAWPKWTHGMEWVATNIMAKRVPTLPAEPVAMIVMVNELVGGICIALGLFTRFFAITVAIEMAVITSVFWPQGGPPYEQVLMWCVFAVAIALRGGGPYSLDRVIGREL